MAFKQEGGKGHFSARFAAEGAYWDRQWRIIESAANGSWASSTYLNKLVSSDSIRGKKVLDIGCGDLSIQRAVKVEMSSTFLRNYSSDYAGLDASEVALEMSKVSYPERVYRSTRFLKGDARELPFGDRSFDVVSVLELLPFVGRDYERVIREAARVAKERIIVSALHQELLLANYSGYPDVMPHGILMKDPSGTEVAGFGHMAFSRLLASNGFRKQRRRILMKRTETVTIGIENFASVEKEVSDTKSRIVIEALRY